MEGRYTQSQAQAQSQKPNRKAKGNPKVQNEPGKAVQKSKMNHGKNEKQASSQSESIDYEFNGKLQETKPAFKTNPNIKAHSPEEVEIQRANLNEKDEAKKQEKPGECEPPTEQAPAVIPNGVKPKPPDSPIDNQEAGKPDNDGSGSEDGYILPKKRKAKRNVPKVEENVNLMKVRTMPPGPRVPLRQSFGNLKLYPGDQRGMRVNSPKSAWKPDRWAVGAGRGRPGPGYMQEKAFNATRDPKSPKVDTLPRTTPTAPVVPKEEGRGLVKQPTAFSVSNSSVAKVTYASKVKQNLYKVQTPSMPLESCLESELSPESGTALPASSAIIEPPILMPGHKLSQVPVSTPKSVNPPDCVNGPEKSTNVERSQVLPLEAHLIKRPSPSPKSASHKMNLKYPAVAPSLFTCPSNTPIAPTVLMPNNAPPQTEVQMLREIFQNEWGLSFFGPEIAQGRAPDPKVIHPPVPPKNPSPLVSQETCVAEHVSFPQTDDMGKRPDPQSLGDIKPTVPKREKKALTQEPSPRDDDPQQADSRSHGTVTLLPSNDKTEHPEPSPTSPFSDPTLKGLGQKTAWEPFDARAAIEYHMTTMKSILETQKQDPQSIIIYDESMDNRSS
ncbi:nuclear fragile X mental retardation-interacting protein 2-like [Dromiciops gliroides]|uniref:nuclear fragile X mental retardation-interacting protein 2-like n=1 Tax=Dromiciops gliroides TaxID=33562 RepID=UPI001CC79BF4|nr:nuclear fragile X mental retardation-interacting protein 2-like [Dromiciops gliroides]